MYFLLICFHVFFFSLTSSGTAISASQASPVLSGVETGSLDRGKAALERRNKKSVATGGSITDDNCAKATARVEVTRVNPDSLIDQLLRATNLDDHSADEENKHSKFNVYFKLIIFRYCYCRHLCYYYSSIELRNELRLKIFFFLLIDVSYTLSNKKHLEKFQKLY